MGYLTKFGTLWGAIPQTAGRMFWVAAAASYTVDGNAYVASDGNDGLSPERAFLTLDYAVGKCTASVGDTILLLPAAHSWSGSVALDVAGITIIGLPYFPISTGNGPRAGMPQATITTSASDEIINVTAADCTLINVKIIPVTQKTGVDFSGAADRFKVYDCVVDLITATGHTSTKGIAATSATIAADDLHFAHIEVYEDNAGTSHGPGVDLGAGKRCIHEKSTYYKQGTTASSTAWAVSGPVVNDNGTFILRDIDIISHWGVLITKGILGADMTQVNTTILRVTGHGCTKLVDDFASGDAVLVHCYMGAAAGVVAGPVAGGTSTGDVTVHLPITAIT